MNPKAQVVRTVATVPSGGAGAMDWVPKTSAEERAGFVRAARAAGETDIADRIGKLDDAAWIDAAIRASEGLLARTEGAGAFDPPRRAALELLDYPLHVDNFAEGVDPKVRAAFEQAAVAHVKRAIARVREEVRTAEVAPGTLRVWHVYNMAYVLKGAVHTVLVDFTPYPYFDGLESWTDDDWEAFAELGDLLVVTHHHRDHTAYPLMRRMLAKGKTLVLPCAITNRYDATDVYLPGDGVVVLDSDHMEPVDVCGVKFRNFCGYQGDVACNSYSIEIDGVTVADNGDNSDINKDARQMDCPPADLLITATWNRPTFFVQSCMLARGFRRDHAVFLPSHENELMHTVPHRESYHELYGADRRLAAPNFVWPVVKPLSLGESLTVRSGSAVFPPRTVHYGSVRDFWHEATLSLPAGYDPDTGFCRGRKALKALIIHGGGWSNLDRTSFAGVGDFLNEEGMVVLNIEYRLASSDVWPACGDDCLAAANYLLRNDLEELRCLQGDPVLVVGASAGGHLALMTGLRLPTEDVLGIVSISGIADPAPDYEAHPGRYEKLFGAMDVAKDAFPLAHLSGKMPPMLLTHYVHDQVVPIQSMANFVQAAMEIRNRLDDPSGVDVETYGYDLGRENQGHGIWIPDSAPHRLYPDIEERIRGFVRRIAE